MYILDKLILFTTPQKNRLANLFFLDTKKAIIQLIAPHAHANLDYLTWPAIHTWDKIKQL